MFEFDIVLDFKFRKIIYYYSQRLMNFLVFMCSMDISYFCWLLCAFIVFRPTICIRHNDAGAVVVAHLHTFGEETK